MSAKHELPPMLSPAERGFILSDLNRNLTGFNRWSLDDVVRATERAVRAQFTERIQRLEAENEALRKDAARLDAIERNARCDPKMDGNHEWWPTIWKHRLTGPTLRAAIDAAMTKEQKE